MASLPLLRTRHRLGATLLAFGVAGCAAILGIEDIPRPAQGDDGGVSAGDGGVGVDAGADAAVVTDGGADGAVLFVNPRLAVAKRDGTGRLHAALHLGTSWYIGGDFTRVSSFPARNVLALDTKGTKVRCPVENELNGYVNAIAQTPSAIYLGGTFTEYAGAPARFIAKIDPVTCALDTKFSPPAANGFDGEVFALAVSSTGDLFVGGAFNDYRGIPGAAINIAKLDIDSGVLDTTFTVPGVNGFDGPVRAFAVTALDVYVGGGFTAYRGVPGSAKGIAKLSKTSGALDTNFSPPAQNGFDGGVLALALSPNALYVGGGFGSYRGTPSGRIAKLSIAATTLGEMDTAFNNGLGGGAVYALAVDDSNLYVGGDFIASGLAKLGLTTGALDGAFSSALGTGFRSNVVRALALTPTELYVGGDFDSLNGVADSASSLARLSLAGVLDTSFKPPGSTANGVTGARRSGSAPKCLSANSDACSTVRALAVAGTTLWVGGEFSLYGGVSARNIAKLDDTTFAVDTTFSPPGVNGFDNQVNALAGAGNTLYVGGSFGSYRGVTANRLAKLDATTGIQDLDFSPPSSNGFNGPTFALALVGTSLYAGGCFSAYRGATSSANNIARIDATSGVLDPAFNTGGTNGFNSSVYALAATATAVYAGGAFSAYKSVNDSANRIAKLSAANASLDALFGPLGTANGFNNYVLSLALDGNDLYAGGYFTAYKGVADSANRLAKIDTTTGNLDTSFSPTGVASNGFDDYVQTLLSRGGSLFVGGNFKSYRGAYPANGIASLDRKTGAIDVGFSPPGGASNGVSPLGSGQLGVQTIAVGPGGDGPARGTLLLVGGGFDAYRGSTARGIVLLDPVSGALR
jgi:hypothetical protein